MKIQVNNTQKSKWAVIMYSDTIRKTTPLTTHFLLIGSPSKPKTKRMKKA